MTGIDCYHLMKSITRNKVGELNFCYSLRNRFQTVMLPLATLSPTSTCKRVLWVTQSNAAPLKKASGEGPARASNDKID